MFLTILTVAGALAQAAAPAAAPAPRSLAAMPSAAVTYWDVPGSNAGAIEKSLKKILADPAKKDQVRLFNYDVAGKISKQTTGDKCIILSSNSGLKSKVQLPRLAEEAKVPKDVVTQWKSYVGKIEADAAKNLWFIQDELTKLDASMKGIACDQANTIWNSGLDKIRGQLPLGAKTAATK